MAKYLGCWIPYLEVPVSKPLVGTKVDCAFNFSLFDQMGTRTSWELKILLSPSSGSVALRQMNPRYKKGP